MDVQIAALCDFASDYEGKLCLIGCFDTIYAQKFPAVHPQCAVALRLLFRKEEEGMHVVRINFIDEDGQSVIPPLDAPVEVGVPDDMLFISRNLVLNLQQLRFPKAGLFSVDVSTDDRLIARIPLKIHGTGAVA